MDSTTSDLLETVSLRKKRKTQDLRSSEIDRALLSDSKSDEVLFSGEDTMWDPDFFEKCQVNKCSNEGSNPCSCGMLVCDVHFELNNCSHDDHFFDSEEEEFKEKRGRKKRKEKLKKQTKMCIKNNNSTKDNENSHNNEEQVVTVDNIGNIQHCESQTCNEEIFASCVNCLALLCFRHFNEDDNCINHSSLSTQDAPEAPEDFSLDDLRREFELPEKIRKNQQKEKKLLRNSGKGYTQHRSLNLVAPKTIKPRCDGKFCTKSGKECNSFSEENRSDLFHSYYGMGNLLQQREYIVRHVSKEEKKRKTTKNEISRRGHTLKYLLPLEGRLVSVCKKFFLNTLGVSEKVVRTSLEKMDDVTGVLQPERRGGRYPVMKETDQKLREEVVNHINRFSRVEGHYVRSDSKREYLHEDLNISRMYRMFVNENPGKRVASCSLYSSILKEMNLGFYRPKKDQCSLCMTYRSGDILEKEKLQETYDKHTAEKNEVRKLKDISKRRAKEDSKFEAAVFDFQQVIHIPRSNESAIFYKRRLGVYNLTIYSLKDRDCHCFTWHEAISKRGSCEIATCVYKYLESCFLRGITSVNLFCDGCAGQNKNTMVVAMMLYAISNLPIQDITLRFFEPNHGQNEGDSTHSAIEYAVGKAGDIFMPSQLVPIMRLARAEKPYFVYQLNVDDFLDFKTLSKDLRILKERKDDQNSGESVNWTKMVDIAVNKSQPEEIRFKTSHLEEHYRSITLKRLPDNPLQKELNRLNKEPPKLSKDKYEDLVSLCVGSTPVVRNNEFVNFYKSLPH